MWFPMLKLLRGAEQVYIMHIERIELVVLVFKLMRPHLSIELLRRFRKHMLKVCFSMLELWLEVYLLHTVLKQPALLDGGRRKMLLAVSLGYLCILENIKLWRLLVSMLRVHITRQLLEMRPFPFLLPIEVLYSMPIYLSALGWCQWMLIM